jgi:hypothetical protein
MKRTNKISTILNREKHELIRKYEKHELSQKEFKSKYDEVENKIQEENKNFISGFYTDRSVVENKLKHTESNKMVEENKVEKEAKVEKVKTEKVKTCRKPMKESYASFIEKGLKMKSLKTIDSVAEKVVEWKPGKDVSGIKRLTKVIIGEIKKQEQPRWKGYTWDAESFLLVGPEE